MDTKPLSSGTILNEKWIIGECIGAGSCGRVYSVVNKHESVNNVEYAIKCIQYGKELSVKKAEEQKKISDTLYLERTFLLPGMRSYILN